jgi:hypothetical protein
VRLRLLVLTVVLMLTAASCDWLMFGFGPARTGFTPDTSISKDAVQSSMVSNWTSTTAVSSTSSPAVARGVVYVDRYAFDAAGTTNCLGSPKTCAPLWTVTAGNLGVSISSPAVVGGVEYVGHDKLYAFDAAGTTNCSGTPKTCAPLWTAETGFTTPGSPAVVDGVVYVGGDRLYAFDAAGIANCSGSPRTCQPLWTAGTGDNAFPPAVVDGVAYVGSADHKLYAFDAAGTTNCSGTPKTCAPLWTATTGGVVFASPAAVRGVVYVKSVDGKLYAYDAAGTTNCSGTPKVCMPLWTATTGGPFSPAVANGVVYTGGNQRLYAFDAAGTTNCSGSPKTCEPLWTATTSYDTRSPAVANGVVYVAFGNGDGFNALAAFDAAGTTNCSGSPRICQPLWNTASQDGTQTSSPVISNGAVYVGSGTLKAYGLETVPPTTSILIPSNGATLSGTAILDASAADNVKVSRVEFRLTGGDFNNALIGVATSTYYGWIAQWETTSVPNGAYTLNSVAFDPANNSGRSADVSITVQN